MTINRVLFVDGAVDDVQEDVVVSLSSSTATSGAWIPSKET